MLYVNPNKKSDQFTASPDKYPQGRFKDKECRMCGSVFSPLAPSHLYCSDDCADIAYTEGYLKRAYGITMADYQRMFEEQNGVCKLCEKEGVKNHPKNRTTLVVDHCHSTKKVRGLLCVKCNVGIGNLKHDPDLIRKAAKYCEGD